MDLKCEALPGTASHFCEVVVLKFVDPCQVVENDIVAAVRGTDIVGSKVQNPWPLTNTNLPSLEP